MDEKLNNRNHSIPSKSKMQAASHDLNNLLNNILSSSELLKDRIGDDITLLQLIKQIELSTTFASEIVSQLYNTNINLEEEKFNVDLQTIVAEVIQLNDIHRKDKINFEFDNSDHTILCNPLDIKKVLLNIIANAKESDTSDVLIDIKIFGSERESVKLVIFDNGNGIPESIRENIFEEGFSTKEKKTNSGIGLSIVKKILDNHNATIDVQSELNTGTTFTICFPSIKIVEKDFNNKKIIIAEDDQFQREVLKELVKTMQIQVFTASNGIEALELFVSEKPDLLFIDESMPGMTGTECSKKIREIDKTSPIVLVSGLNFDEKRSDGFITKILKKPYSFETVKSTLLELL